MPFGNPPQAVDRNQLCSELIERQKTPPSSLRQFNCDVDRDLDQLVQACLSMDESQRPSAQQLADALRRFFSGTRRARRSLTKHRMALRLAVLTSIVVATSIACVISQLAPFAVREVQAIQKMIAAGDFKAASARAQAVLDVEPQNTKAMFLRGRAEQSMGAYQRAFDFYCQANEAQPSGELFAVQGYCASRCGRHRAGIALFLQAVEMGFAPAEVWNDLGYCSIQLGEHDQAIEYLNRAIEQRNDLAAAYYNRALSARLFAKTENHPIAIGAKQDIETAIRLGHSSAEGYCNAAIICLSVDSQDTVTHELARTYLNHAIELGLPNDAWANNPKLANLAPAMPASATTRQMPQPDDDLLDPISVDISAFCR